MASSDSNTGGATGVGCLALIVLGILGWIYSFVVEHWEFFVGAAVVLGSLTVVVLVTRTLFRSTVGRKRAAAAAAEKTRRGRNAVLEESRRAGRNDMRTAWLEWQIRPGTTAPQSADAASVVERLAVIPKPGWNLTQLRMHGRAVWARRGGTAGRSSRADVEARLDRVAAMISDLTDEEFDTRRGQTNEQYLYHPDREVRAAYLEGGAQGVETIMGTITAARAQAREDAATRASAESLAQQRNAALRALRETRQATENRDAHAAWDEEARRAGE
ncbi:hypothetical protein [Kocuria turfanensis]|uniref:Uncharacterized protein n=1 Tax=Kocuria turfanensis TaxID=388357 RepID=A0A512IEY6_9MICC|nr:hypothetical protein [Kocuria turfanensis]GEO96217.1 hypothetical protein KTU01_23400 [Kocuria turfanensis]